MFSLIRRHFGAGGLVATFAVFLSMAGGAWAAKRYLITSTNQISPKVLKELQGKRGPTGSQGATGPVGAQGGVGSVGPKGEAGPKGEQGVQGEPGKPGEPGHEGHEGKYPTELPKGQTERGTWAFGSTTAEGIVQVAISFPIPLSTNVKPYFVNEKEIAEGKEPTECEGGSIKEPKAKAGALCVYSAGESGNTLSRFKNVEAPGTPVSEQAGINGVVMIFSASNEELGRGDWAATAP